MSAKKKKSLPSAVLNFIGTAIIVIIIAVCLALSVPKVFGVNSYTVLTGSMVPSIPVGSVVYAKAADPASLAAGEVIVFYDGHTDIPITHRIIENDTARGQVVTKGDANETQDLMPIPYMNIVGRVCLHIPILGYIASPLSSLMGKLAMAAIIVAGLLICEIARRIR